MATAFANLLRDEALRQGGPVAAAVLLFLFPSPLAWASSVLPAMLAVPLAIAFAALYGAEPMALQWSYLWLLCGDPDPGAVAACFAGRPHGALHAGAP